MERQQWGEGASGETEVLRGVGLERKEGKKEECCGEGVPCSGVVGGCWLVLQHCCMAATGKVRHDFIGR